MEVTVNDVVMPGDKVKEVETSNKQKIILGPGLRTDGENIYACKAGILKNRLSIYYVDSYQKRFFSFKTYKIIYIRFALFIIFLK